MGFADVMTAVITSGMAALRGKRAIIAASFAELVGGAIFIGGSAF